jgi:plastocyanin
MPNPVLCRRRLLAGSVLATLAAPARAATVVVTIDDFVFQPASLTVPAGTTVVWENHDSTPHTILSVVEPRSFRSKALGTGDRFEVTFATPGIHRYFCGLHPHMQGVVVVE